MTAQFSADGRLVSTGTKAINKLGVGSTPLTDGMRFVLRWGSQAVELVVRTNPTEPNEMPAGDVSDAHLTAIIEVLKNYFPLREDFTNFHLHADTGGGLFQFRGIRFEARRPGAAYSLVPFLQTGLLGLLPVAGVDPTYRDRYSVYAEIWAQQPGGSTNPETFVRVADQTLDVDQDGFAQLDVGEVLHPLLDADWPNWNVPELSRSIQSGRAYYIAYSEAWGNPIRPGRMKQTPVRWAYVGGADYRRRAAGGFSLTDRLVGTSADKDRALRLGNDGARYVAPDGVEFLTFLNTRLFRSTVQATVVLTYDDGSGQTITNLLSAVAWARGEKLTVPAGPAQLGLPANVPAGRYLKEYTVRLYSGGGPASGQAIGQAYRFVVDYARRPYARPFAYLNSFGCPAVLTAWGKGSSEWQRFGELAERSLPTDYSAQDGAYSEYDVSLQQTIDVVTGFRPEAELRGWFDFYRSPEKLRLTRQAAAIVALPIAITSKSIKEAKDGETLHAHAFSYTYRFRELYWPDDDPGDDTPPPGFQPVGSVSISIPQVINSVDATVPSVARKLTDNDLTVMKQVAAFGNHAMMGYLNQNLADALYVPKVDAQQQQADQSATVSALSLTVAKSLAIRVRAIYVPPTTTA